MQGSANLNLMIKAARKAGRSLVKDFREVENLQVSTKGPGDFVSKADREAERLIKEELLGARPTYGWLGEETGGAAGADPTRRWIVDPLDGTTNFLHGMPHWAVSIALEHKGEVVAGVVFDAAKDEMFYAEKGQGAWMNQSQRLRVSGRARCRGHARLGAAAPCLELGTGLCALGRGRRAPPRLCRDPRPRSGAALYAACPAAGPCRRGARGAACGLSTRWLPFQRHSP